MKNPEDIAKISSITHEKIGFDAISLPFDNCFEAEAMGCYIKRRDLKEQNILKHHLMK